MNIVRRAWLVLWAATIQRLRFHSFGFRSFILKPLQIVNPKFIEIGDRVRIRHHIRMEALDSLRIPRLVIGDNCNIEQNVHIICSSSVRIGRDCSITAGCAIVDTWHPFTHIGASAKIGESMNSEPSEVVISDGCFLGVGAVIQPNVRLGRRCVVGANAVVLAGTYPDGSILAGIPARVIRTIAPEDY